MPTPEPLARPPRRLLRGLLVAGITLVVLLLAVEAGLRVAGYDPMGAYLQGTDYFLRSSPHAYVDYELVPGTRGDVWGTHLEINERGLRGPERAVPKPDGVRRLAVLGDSITFGNDLAVEEIFPTRLEALFAGSDPPLEVLNLAVGGYDCLDQVGALEHTGLALEPDAVAVAWCVNDIGSESVNLNLVRFLERYGAAVRHSRLLQLMVVRTDDVTGARDFRRENLDDVMRERHPGRIASIGDDPELMRRIRALRGHLTARNFRSRHPYLEWYLSEVKVGRMRFAFDELRRIADERELPVVIALLPILDQEGQREAYRLAYDIVRHEAVRCGFAIVELDEAFFAAGIRRLAQGEGAKRDRIHPNAEGHRIIAEQLAEELPRLAPSLFAR